MASSSPSSDEVGHHDTPSTIGTAFSPDATGSSESKTKARANAPTSITLPTLGRTHGDDVFLNAPLPTSGDLHAGLSPTADVFTPGFALSPGVQTPRAHPPVGHVAVRNAAAHGVIGEGAKGGAPANMLLPDLRNMNIAASESLTLADLAHSEGVFSTDEHVNRSFIISLATPITSSRLRTLELMDLGRLETAGVIAATFSDVREAKQAYALCSHSGWQVAPLNPREAAFHQGAFNAGQVSLFEGQVIVAVYYDDRDQPPARAALAEFRRQLRNFGSVKAMASFPSIQRNVREFRVEYFDLHGTARLLAAGTITAEGFVFSAERFAPDLAAYTPPPAAVYGRQVARAPVHLSATGRSTIPVGTPGYEALLNTLQDGVGGRRNAGHAFTRIDVQRIELGLDVRTTVMLRNIPNRVTSLTLKEILDETSHGTYDFMYLRIDFANNCNVGYAFINFVDPLAIIPFAEAHQGKRWNAFNSDKIAEISYATIQGRENLIEKFRNSSVMLEHPDFRPKLFYTGHGAGAGQEEPFPGPNNLQKMRRSVENAEHVGLYRPSAFLSPGCPPVMSPRSPGYGFYDNPAQAIGSGSALPHSPATPAMAKMQLVKVNNATPCGPSADRDAHPNRYESRLFAPRQGQAYREEQRRRRSQFDRGTPGAELEMVDFRGAPRGFGAVKASPPVDFQAASFRKI
ncbi:hypothetical protein DV735_g3673, partial [Chaetothyriales sp. CBS 134920]